LWSPPHCGGPAELCAPGGHEAHPGDDGGRASGVAVRGDAEEAGDELVVGEPDGETAAGERGR
jgi:hypothetical protein